MLKNSETRWGVVSRVVHWSFVAAIAVEVVAGFVMSRTYAAAKGDPAIARLHDLSGNLHHTAGLLFIVAVIGRLAWRLSGPTPGPAGRPHALRDHLAGSTHWMLYALLLLIPLSGWASLSALADSERFGPTVIWFFGHNGFESFIPRIVPPVPWDTKALLGYSTFAKAHRWLLMIGAGLLTLHVLAALYHHLILRDDTLRRMLWPRRETPRPD